MQVCGKEGTNLKGARVLTVKPYGIVRVHLGADSMLFIHRQIRHALTDKTAIQFGESLMLHLHGQGQFEYTCTLYSSFQKSLRIL